MSESEIMNCAAILAAGILANSNNRRDSNATAAFSLMEEIANLIREDEKQNEIQYKEI